RSRGRVGASLEQELPHRVREGGCHYRTREAAMTDTAPQASGYDAAGPDASDDAALITPSLHTPDCFGALFDRHAPAISRYIARRLGPDAADDLVAETFLAAFRRRARYDAAQADARPWLYGIATRLIGRHRRGGGPVFPALPPSPAGPPGRPGPSPTRSPTG